MRYASPRAEADARAVDAARADVHGAHAPSVFQPGAGFDEQLNGAPYIALVDDGATSWAYVPGDGTLGSSLSARGFLGAFTPRLHDARVRHDRAAARARS